MDAVAISLALLNDTKVEPDLKSLAKSYLERGRGVLFERHRQDAGGLEVAAAYSTVMDTKGQRMVARDYQPQARLAQHHKDVRLICELAWRHGAQAPLSELHEELLARAIELGYGEADNSAIVEVFRSPSDAGS